MSTITIKPHNLETIEDGHYHYQCKACNQMWKNKPVSKCPGVPVVKWGKWSNDLMTKTQLDQAGYQTGKQLPPVAAVVPNSKMPTGWMFLYDSRQATKKGEISDKQREMLDRARDKALEQWICKQCKSRLSKREKQRGVCETCKHQQFLNSYHNRAIQLSRQWLEDPANIRILDSETTGLWGAEIVEIAVIDGLGNVLLNQRVQPERPDKMLERDHNGVCASDIHGILPEHLLNEPHFIDVYPKIKESLEDKTIIVYNYGYDIPLIIEQMIEHKIISEWKEAKFSGHCAMELYAQFVGHWSSRHRSFRWHKLEGGDHSALGDCLATLEVIKEMAKAELREIAKTA